MRKTREKNISQPKVLAFDPIILVKALLSRWAIVLLISVAVGVLAYVAADIRYEPVYKTRTTFVVTTKGSSATVYSNLSSTNNLATVFTELLNSSMLKKTVVQEMGKDSFDAEIETTVIPGTNLITMTITASDPSTAFLAAQTIIEHHEDLTYKVVDNIILEVLQSPVVPVAPSNRAGSAEKMKLAMKAAAIIAILALAVQSCSHDTVRSEKEAQEKLDCDLLGAIPHERKHKTLRSYLQQHKTSILVTSPLSGFRFVEAVRKLRRRVEKRMRGEKVLMITSLLENEGKSTVAVNLALTMEQAGKRVLIIDCDMHQPACSMILEQKNVTRGLHDYLQNRAALADVLVRYDNKDLYLLLERKSSVRSADLLGSRQMQDLLEWARETFDVVILDMPPVFVASDAEIMKEFADASMLVVRQHMAVAEGLNKAISALDNGKAKLIGCVLNNVYSNPLAGQVYGGGYSHYGNYDHYKQYTRNSKEQNPQ